MLLSIKSQTLSALPLFANKSIYFHIFRLKFKAVTFLQITYQLISEISLQKALNLIKNTNFSLLKQIKKKIKTNLTFLTLRKFTNTPRISENCENFNDENSNENRLHSFVSTAYCVFLGIFYSEEN